jgi:PhoH-like ATPase
MKAKSLGIIAQDYQNDKVANIDDLYKGIQVLDGVDHALINKLYEVPDGVNAAEFNIDPNLKGHQFFIMKNSGSSALAHIIPQASCLTG